MLDKKVKNKIDRFINIEKIAADDINNVIKDNNNLFYNNKPSGSNKKNNAKSFLLNKIKQFYKNNDLFRFALWAIILLLLSTALLTIVERGTFYDSVSEHLDNDKPTIFDTLFNAFWWSVVTFTTVGYGDVSPVSHLGKTLSILIMILNFCVVTLLSGAVASVLVAARLKGDDKLDKNIFKGHLIIAGWNSFVKSTLKLIEKDENANHNVILINESDPETVRRSISTFEVLNITLLSENYTQDTILKKAFIEKCGTFMIVPDESGLLPNEKPDEDKTVLTALTSKSISEDIKVVAQVLNPDYVSHLKRANVNEIVFTDSHIPYLLSKHVTDPGVPQLYDTVIDPDEEGKGFQVLNIPSELKDFTHNQIAAYFKLKHQLLLIGYAINKSGFSLEEEMSEGGDIFIKNMITEQLEGAGVKLSNDEHVVVELNPPDTYKIDDKHSALVLR